MSKISNMSKITGYSTIKYFNIPNRYPLPLETYKHLLEDGRVFPGVSEKCIHETGSLLDDEMSPEALLREDKILQLVGQDQVG